MATEERTEGICLQMVPYLEKGRIFKVFTPTYGLISFMGKKPAFSALSPFCLGEWVFKRGNSDLFFLEDGHVMNPYLSLRTSYQALETAGFMAKAILSSQLLGKGAPRLYLLLLSYFNKLSQFTNPHILSSSFFLKLLEHDGLFCLKESCSPDFPFDPEDYEVLAKLIHSPTFSELNQLHLTKELEQKIEHLFKRLLKA